MTENPSNGSSGPDKIAPHSSEAEEAVLGSILINPDSMLEVASFLQAADFFILRNGWIWEAVCAVHERGEAIDNLTVIQELRNRNQLDSIGGSAYITSLINNTPTHIHAETYARIVERAAMRRRLLAAAGDIAQIALEENDEIGDVIEHAEAVLFAVTERRLDSRDEWEGGRFGEARGRVRNRRLYMDDPPAMSVPQMRTKSRRLYREHGLDLIIVDYLQLMNGGLSRNENRVQEISAISRGLKELAREINVPVLAAAQLSRAVEQRADKRPMLSDLRESGSIEQDSDIVMFIYRDDMYDENSERQNQADIIIAKHRNGPTGVVSLFFRKEVTQFTNMQKSNINLAGF